MLRARAIRGLVTLALAAGMLVVPVGDAKAAGPTEYVKMSDGVLIAVNVQLPEGHEAGQRWPTIIQIDGYAGASSPMNPASPTWGGGRFATVHMSLRGTGCSGGTFDLFDRRSSLDGYEVIEWIADQEWSDETVTIWGHSYSGLTGWLVAATQPPSLKAMSVSGLIDDLYRGIVYMGGVSNLGFPLLWTGAYRPASEYQGGVVPGVQDGLSKGDPTCLANQATHKAGNPMDDPIVNGVMALGEDGQWWASHSTITYLDGIDVPIHIVQSYQDEQTGPRGSNLLWQRLDERKPDLPKRLILTNGVHSTNTNPPEIRDDRIAWLDCHVRLDTVACGRMNPSNRVSVLFEMHSTADGLVANGHLDDADWPLSVTQWERYYLGEGGSLSTAAPASAGQDVYAAGSKRAGFFQYYVQDEYGNGPDAQVAYANLPDEVRYQTAVFASDTAIAGPINVHLWAQSTAPDTEFYVELNDVDATGNVTRLQRGLLKASHRRLDALRTDYNDAGDVIRPHHPHTNTLANLPAPGTAYEYDIEVFPVGHVFRAGHSLLVRVTTPPASDSIAVYVPTTAPGVNTILWGPGAQSWILLPVVPVPSDLGAPLACGAQVGLDRCLKPVA